MEIAASTAESFRRLFAEAPIVALLSFSTHGSADHAAVDKVRVRGAVRPGDTVVYACEMTQLRPKVMRFRFQAILHPQGEIVAEGRITGIRTQALG